METLLAGVVGVALVIAAAMGIIAWRVLRRDRAREDTRVALLQALAHRPDSHEDFSAARVDDNFTTHAPTGSILMQPAPAAGSRAFAFVVMAVLGLSTGAGVVYALYRPDVLPSATTTPSVSAPLELVALSHRHGEDGRFLVSGVIANPPAGLATGRLVAVVSAFDAQGDYLTTGKALVEFPKVLPGDESPFSLQLAAPARIARYRLTFREDDGGPVRHIDRRHTSREATASDIEVSRQ